MNFKYGGFSKVGVGLGSQVKSFSEVTFWLSSDCNKGRSAFETEETAVPRSLVRNCHFCPIRLTFFIGFLQH